jgi:S-adenosylmethionine:tRNA ribosyltransferase-isomerase
MLTEEFNYNLPKGLIAQTPLAQRDQSRLMLIHKNSQQISHLTFHDILQHLNENDVLVLNDTKVIKARLFAHRKSGAKIEIFLLSPIKENTWKVLLKPAKRLRIAETLTIAENLSCTVLQKNLADHSHIMEFQTNSDFYECLNTYGYIPVPPYINAAYSSEINQLEQNYQTAFANCPGAVAAPTAGLHYTTELLEKIRQKNVGIEFITLHVGYGTFKPVTTDNILDHKMHEETYDISQQTAKNLTQAKKNNKRIIAIGTTVARTLESAYTNNKFNPGTNATDIFIYPGYQFQAISGLLTNFHLPKSTLLMLVSAFAGTQLTKQIYQEAIKLKYRFYSFGDAMLVLQ